MGREHGIEAYRGNDAISRSSLSSGAILGEGVGKRAGLSYLLTFYLMYILVEFESFLVSVAMFLIVCRSFVRSCVRLLARSHYAPPRAHMRLYAAETGTPDGSIHKDESLTAKRTSCGRACNFLGRGWLVVCRERDFTG
jgi:hypothetical protein